jgi:SAM-dependent methyltransferase
LYKPELSDIVTPASFRGDAEWYRSKARQCGGPVLELGEGTGRISLGIAQDGVSVHALDADPAMLERLTQKLAQQPPEVREHVVVRVGDMRTFKLTGRFALSIAPFRGFLHNLTERDELACLDRVREHLRPGGCFAFNVFHPSLEYMAHHAGALAGVWRWPPRSRVTTAAASCVRSPTNTTLCGKSCSPSTVTRSMGRTAFSHGCRSIDSNWRTSIHQTFVVS